MRQLRRALVSGCLGLVISSSLFLICSVVVFGLLSLRTTSPDDEYVVSFDGFFVIVSLIALLSLFVGLPASAAIVRRRCGKAGRPLDAARDGELDE